MFSRKLVIIVGPTASGKSKTAVFLAQKLNGEIISADSIQVYRGFDIGSAKPAPETLRIAKHHLIDVADAGDDFSMGDFVRMAEKIIDGIWEREKIPIVAGGTGLYIRGLLKGVFDAPKRDEEYRGSLREIAEQKGVSYLHDILTEIDPEAAKKIMRNDSQRIFRALELSHKTKRTMSELIREDGFGRDRYESIKIGVNLERGKLYEKIDARVDEFFRNGLIDEVRSLLASGVDAECNAFKAVGYREVVSFLSGEIDRDTMISLVKRNTRRYAKRQMTWFRKEEGIRWFIFEDDAAEKFDEIKEHVLKNLQD